MVIALIFAKMDNELLPSKTFLTVSLYYNIVCSSKYSMALSTCDIGYQLCFINLSLCVCVSVCVCVCGLVN